MVWFFDENQRLLRHLAIRIDEIMPALDDLNAAVQKVSDAVTAAVTDIKTLTDQIKAGNSSNDPAIEDAANKLNAVADALNAAVAPPPAP